METKLRIALVRASAMIGRDNGGIFVDCSLESVFVQM